MPRAKAKKPRAKAKKPKGDRHKPRCMVGIPEAIAAPLDELAKREGAKLTQYVKALCVKHLAAEGFLTAAAKS